LNLRGSDSDCTPYFISYLVLNFEFNSSSTKGTLYILREKIPREVEEYLKSLNIDIKDYDDFLKDVKQIDSAVYIDKSIANSALCEAFVGKKEPVSTKPNIINHLKGIKNKTEIQGFIDCHVRDGAAIVTKFSMTIK